MSKLRVLLIQEVLFSYRIPILERIAKDVDLEVICVSMQQGLEASFPFSAFRTISIGPVKLMPGLADYCKRFDVVILQPHISLISVCYLPFRRKKGYVPVSWDIGVRASYGRNYSLDRQMGWDDRLYRHILRHCAANIFYMPEPVPVWTARGVPAETLFVAHNTVAVSQTPYSPDGRKDFLFLGSLYPQKRVDLLIDAYREARAGCGNPDSFPKLHSVGGGSEEPVLMAQVNREGMEDSVVFHHAVYDEAVLSRLFQQSLLCISPHQAGLSILKSFAYGTPFVTRRDAITGGEIYNIRNGENGILYERDTDLAPLLSDAAAHPDKYWEMGRAAHRFYATEASPEAMVKGIMDAVHYAIAHPK